MAETKVIPLGRKLSVTITRSKRSSKHDKSTQTMYRDSEAQTVPWSPEVIFKRREGGVRICQELLPPGEGSLGLENVLLMERSRQKQAWEETLPKTASKRNNAIRLSCIASIAANEIAFRESVLDAEGEKRLELSKENIRDERERMLMSLRTRLENMKWEKSKENAMIIKLSNRQFRRKMRKLKLSHLTRKMAKSECEPASVRSRPVSDLASEKPGKPSPLLKDEGGFSRYLAEFSGIELLEKQIGLSENSKFTKPRKPSRTSKVCSRVVLHAGNEFEKLRSAQKGEQSDEVENRVSLRKQLKSSVMLGEDLREIEREEEARQASLLLGKIVKGRAVQTQILSNLMEFKAREPDSRQDEETCVYKTAPTKSATNKEPSSFVILGEMLKTPVQSRPASPSGRVSPFRGHGFKSPAVSRPPSPDPPKRKAATARKPVPPPKPKIKKDIGLPPKSPRRAKPRPKNNIVQKTNLGVDKGKSKPPNRTPRPIRKPLSTASNKKTDKPPSAEEIIIGQTPKETNMKEVTEALSNLVGETPEAKTEADEAEENEPEPESISQAMNVKPQEEETKAEEQRELEDGKSDPNPAEDPKPPQLLKKESEKLIPCLQPDKCNIAPPTMASPSPIITSAINAPSITSGSALTKTTESIETAQASTVTTTSLNALSSAVTISGTLAKKSQSHKESASASTTVPDPPPPVKEEDKSLAIEDGAKSLGLPETQTAMAPHSHLTVTGAKQESTNPVHSDVISTSDMIKADSELELLSANSLRDSPPRQPNPAWNDRLANGDVPSIDENRSKFRRFLSSLWRIIKYILCCRCVLDRCRRAACCKCNCRRSGQSKCCSQSCGRLNALKNCCGGGKCKKPKCCERSRCCGGGSKTNRKRCAKANCSCRGCCEKLKNSCSNCSGKVNSFCRALFCLNLICCQKCLRKCCKPCHKLKCCQTDGFCSCFNPSARKPPKLDKRASTQSKTDKEDLDPVLVEHVSLMKAAIPVLPTCWAVLCLILNLIFPGLGTLLSGVLCLCCGKPRFSVKDTAKNRVGSFCVNLVIGVAQLFTIVFCLVGWGWSIWWGVIMYRLARKRRRIKLAEKSTQEANSANHNHVDVEKG